MNNNQQTIAKALAIIQRIPFTRAVMLTGSFAEGRGTEKSDIDFFIQVQPGHLWLARAIVTLGIAAAGIRRTDTAIAGRICLNWFATYHAPQSQAGRRFQVLWQEDQRPLMKSIIEFLISVIGYKWLEFLVKKYQIARIERDPRTHQAGSQVRYSDRELGFHPPKQR